VTARVPATARAAVVAMVQVDYIIVDEVRNA